MDIPKILKKVLDKNRIPRLVLMILGTFLLGLNYNVFLKPNDLIVGGTTSLAIIFNDLFGWNDQIFIYVTAILLIGISFIFLGKDKTMKSIFGSILYPVMITLTAPLGEMLATKFVFDDMITTVAFTSILYGVAYGIVYKMEYTTGGSDIIMQIVCKYMHMPEGQATILSNVFIILFGGIVFGIPKVVYGIIILYVSSIIVDKIVIGISESKMFIINSTKIDEIEEVIINELKLGVTRMKAEGGYTSKKRDILLCVVPNRDYYMFKEIILELDKDAFFIINDCYDIEGGTTRKKERGLNSLY